MRICVDAGHDGVRDCGAVGQRGCLESDITLYAALALKENLQARGHEVVMTRECNDERLYSLMRRVNIANDAAADLFISLHCNAAENTAAKGMEVFTSPGETRADPFATMIYEELAAMFPDQVSRTDYTDGDPDKEAHFTVLMETNMPAVLVEMGFISNWQEEAELCDPKRQADIAVAIGRAVDRYAAEYC